MSDMGIILFQILPYRRKKNRELSVYGDKDIYLASKVYIS